MLAANGPGPKLAARAAEVLKEHFELDGLVSIGFCGALAPELKPCDVLVATSLVAAAHAVSVPRSHSCQRPPATLLSTDQVAATAESKRTLHTQTQADAVEMEAAGLAPLAAGWHIPFYAVKAVTDTAAESFPLDFNRLRDAQGRFSRGKIIAAALHKPVAFPALMKLNRRCKHAAEALGDFIADARF